MLIIKKFKIKIGTEVLMKEKRKQELEKKKKEVGVDKRRKKMQWVGGKIRATCPISPYQSGTRNLGKGS